MSRKLKMTARKKVINQLKKTYGSKMANFPPEGAALIPEIAPTVVFNTEQTLTDVISGLELVVKQVDRLFDTYAGTKFESSLCIIPGKWTQDYVEGFFGTARGRKAHHTSITILDLFNNLRFLQSTGKYLSSSPH